MLTDIIDSHYAYVLKRLISNNARVVINGVSVAQPMGGMLDARDWPQTQVVEGALYLLAQRVVPSGGTKSQRRFTCFCQWSWVLLGTDLSGYQEGANRGDRYRQNMQIEQNIREACYPNSCQKMVYSVDSEGVGSGVAAQSVYPASSTEWVLWNEPTFRPRLDADKSGAIFGGAAVDLVGYDNMIPAAEIMLSATMGAQIVA